MQSAAIPYRQLANGAIEVLLVTSRTRRRWILPKGKVPSGMLPHQSAAREALEEAGVIGVPEDTSVGDFTAAKQNADGTSQVVTVRAFPLAVKSELPRWREDHQRERRWLPLQRAIEAIDDPGIRQLLVHFASLRRIHQQSSK